MNNSTLDRLRIHNEVRVATLQMSSDLSDGVLTPGENQANLGAGVTRNQMLAQLLNVFVRTQQE